MFKKVATIAVVVLLAAGLGLSVGSGCAVVTEKSEESEPDFGLLQELWDIIHEEYVERENVDLEALIRGAAKGMVDALDDPYSAYMEADAYEMSIERLSGKFDGIGAFVGYDEGRIIIIAPIPDSPADGAGIRSGDIILAVDDEPTTDMNIMDAVTRIRGPRGTPVRLLVLHEGDTEPVEIKIVRAEITVPSVIFEMLDDIAHIRITNFSERTGSELATALRDAQDSAATGIILDLRGNPGGLLSSVVEVAGHFLDKGTVVSVVDNQGNRTDSPVRRSARAVDLPMVVLVDGFSASGSEVLAGALQDYDRAVVAGARTFGKGSVNNLLRLSDGSGLYITVARWYTPNGRLIEGEGIEPDHVLDPEEQDPLDWAREYLREGA